MISQSAPSFLARVPGSKGFWLSFLLLAVLLGWVFRQGFVPDHTVFSNDGPLGLISAESNALPEGYKGVWIDLHWLGGRWIGASPNFSTVLAWLAGPILFSKLYPAYALLLLGLCTWFFFRQLGFGNFTCILGSIASVLNTSAFSIACWGLPMWAITRAMIFLALAVLVSKRGNKWLRACLAGLAVGMGVAEGFDVGAICSLIMAVFVFWQSAVDPDRHPRKLVVGALRVGLVAIFAAFIAAQTLSGLVGTQVQGIAGTGQDERTKEEQWDWATQWSLPKIEITRVLVSGLFGYRMDTPEGGQYWGGVGRQPGWEQHKQGLPRHSGAGEYAGVLVVLVAAWALAQSFRKTNSVYTPDQKKFIWFWAATAFVCALLAFGRHAPFYQLLYQLPYFSTIRNPVKFMHPFHIGLLILFGFGLHGLSRLYLEKAGQKLGGVMDHLKNWWAGAALFDRRFVLGLGALFGISLLALLIFSSSRGEIQAHLTNTAFTPQDASAIYAFSFKELGWYVFFLALSSVLLLLVISGFFAGPRMKFAALLLGAVLLADLVRANQPWIITYNYKEKYDTNSLVEYLKQRPYENRVTVLPFQIPQLQTLQQVYHVYWMQHTFPIHNIQTLDIVQEPRVPQEKIAYQSAFSANPLRYWQLTNTRFLLGMVGLDQLLNQQLDPGLNRFRVHIPFNLRQEKTDGAVYADTNSVGPYALMEFTGALPRVKLYKQWQVETNLDQALKILASTNFNPETTVLISKEISAPPSTNSASPGSVEFTSYAPKTIKLKAENTAPSVLLLNDRYDPYWKAFVNGAPAEIFRANYIMRGIYLPPGTHQIEFHFQLPMTAFYISLAAIATAGALLALLFVGPFTRRHNPGPPSNSSHPSKK